MGVAPNSTAYNLKQLRFVLLGILLILSIGAVYFARDFLLPLTLAVLIAITFRPAVRWMALHGVPAWGTATSFAGLLLLGSFLIGYVISVPVADLIARGPAIRQTFVQKVHKISAPLEQVSKITDDIKAAAAPVTGASTTEVTVKETNLPSLLWIAAYPASYTLMFSGAIILSLFLMASGDLLLEKLLNIMPTLTDKKNAFRVVQDIEHEVSVYLVTHSAINAGVGVAVALLFYVIGMPTAYLWAFAAFALNFIPYIGPMSGVALSALVSFTLFDSLSYAILPPLTYLAIIVIEGQLISPSLLGRRLRLNSVAILISLAFWGWIWGIAGVIVAVPLLVTLRVFTSHFPSLAAVGEFVGEADGRVNKVNEKILGVDQNPSVKSSVT